jgi:Dyp-type peroxidase family
MHSSPYIHQGSITNSRMSSLQEGIYYKKGSRPGQSLGIIFLRTDKSSDVTETGQIIKRIWHRCQNLKKGNLKDLEGTAIGYPKLYDDLTVLIGYGANIFDLKGALRKKPRMFSDDYRFAEPRKGGASIFPGSDLTYHDDLTENHAASDDIVIQFISECQFVTNQVIFELWHELLTELKESDYNNKVSITKFYDGFRRSDNRNWLGFHDGLSNIKTEERKGVIAIDRSHVNPDDQWLVEGTFMSFIRIMNNMQKWWEQSPSKQEIMVGRDKVTGCPLIGSDGKKNIVMRGCPVPGTKEVTDKGNELFRNHPPYGFQYLPPGVSDEMLKLSHIGSMRLVKRDSSWRKEESTIFRQGFEFLEHSNQYPGLNVGLNFISFQNNPNRLFNTMTGWNNKKSINTRSLDNHKSEISAKLEFNTYFRVLAAGIFVVPPDTPDEDFPGASIFFSGNKMKKGIDIWKR